MILRDFECPKCGISEKLVKSGVSEVVCCGVTAQAVLSVPHLGGTVGLSGDEGKFNPHYDLSVGQYFGSLEEKKRWLKKKDYQQDGTASPRKTNKTRILYSREQARKFKNLKKAASLM